jgi:hypothetical protein
MFAFITSILLDSHFLTGAFSALVTWALTSGWYSRTQADAKTLVTAIKADVATIKTDVGTVKAAITPSTPTQTPAPIMPTTSALQAAGTVASSIEAQATKIVSKL